MESKAKTVAMPKAEHFLCVGIRIRDEWIIRRCAAIWIQAENLAVQRRQSLARGGVIRIASADVELAVWTKLNDAAVVVEKRRNAVEKRGFLRTAPAGFGVSHDSIPHRVEGCMEDVHVMIGGKVGIEREPEQALIPNGRDRNRTERLAHELPLRIDDTNGTGKELVEEHAAIRRQGQAGRELERSDNGLQLQIAGRRLADREVERIRRFAVLQFNVILIGENYTDGMGGGPKSEDVKRRRRFPMNEVGMDAVVEDPVVIVYAGSVVEPIRHRIGIEIKMQVILSWRADLKGLRGE